MTARLLFEDLTLIKDYMRYDDDTDDSIIEMFEVAAERKVMKIAGMSEEDFVANAEAMRPPVLYATAYMLEHRQEADHAELDITLRALVAQERDVPV